MEADAISKFEEYLGKEKFERFILEFNISCRIKGKLHYWMESVVKSFRTEVSEYAQWIPCEDCRICPIHRLELKTQAVDIVYGYFDQTYVNERREKYPFSNKFVIGPDWGGTEKVETVLYCDRCRELEPDR